MQIQIALMSIGLKKKPTAIQNKPLDQGIKQFQIEEPQTKIIGCKTSSSSDESSSLDNVTNYTNL